ncbi:MAG: glutaminyl-peptide cyclotransferase [Terracidiphilus sp.]
MKRRDTLQVGPRLRIAVLALCLTMAAAGWAQPADGYRVVHAYPHDPQAFTQGLVYIDGHIYESTGLNGRSSLRMVDLATGKVQQEFDLPQQYFGEGLAPWGSTLVQLTWQNHVAFVYDRFSFRWLRTIPCPWDGWGLTEDGKSLILSDGSSTLRFLDPSSFHERREITVKDHGKPIDKLNELEYIHGEIYANIWYSDRIARISPATGAVLGWIDLTGLLPAAERTNPDAVLNGIAYDAAHDRLFVTGKLWPKLFEIKVVPKNAKLVPVHKPK